MYEEKKKEIVHKIRWLNIDIQIYKNLLYTRNFSPRKKNQLRRLIDKKDEQIKKLKDDLSHAQN